MSMVQRVTEWLGLREASESPTPAGVLPPARSATLANVTADRALTLGTVFRAVQVLATAGSQLSIKVERNGKTLDNPGSIIKTPSLSMHRPAFLEETINSLALCGNCFWLLNRPGGPTGDLADITILPANEVRVAADPDTLELRYWHRSKEYRPWQIRHLKYLRITGKVYGLGPIQAAQKDLSGAIDARDYAAGWFTETDEPTGILATEQDLTAEKAKRNKQAWKREGDFAPEDGNKKRDIRVLGSGVKYQPLMLKPADVQFLESQQFSTTQISRLFGIPAGIMLAAVEGNSQTYSNVEQEWIGFVRFTLMKYLLEIECVLTDLLPLGQRARFNIDALLRTDTKTRYEAHALALGRWKLLEEVRADEGLPELTEAQRAELDKTTAEPLPTPKESANASTN